MKKLLLTLGSLVAIVAPVASVVACGTKGTEDAIDISKAKTMEELVSVLGDAQKKTIEIEKATHKIHVHLKDGSDELDVTISKENNPDSVRTKANEFIKRVLQRRKIDTTDKNIDVLRDLI